MEEVDSIILHFLRQLNINIDDEVKNLSDLPVGVIVESASKCLITINPSIKTPSKLPPGISQRIEVAAQIASACKDLGYKNDVGYQTFLYYNEAELRQVFMFLIELLPTEGKHPATGTTPDNKKNLLMQSISNKIAQDLNSVWIPPCCNPPKHKSTGDFIPNKDSWSHTSQSTLLTEEEIIKKLQNFKNNSNSKKEPVNSKLSTLVVDDNEAPVENNCEHAYKDNYVNKSVKELKEMAIILRQKLDTLESERNVMNVEFTQAQKACERAEADLRNVKDILNSIGITANDSENLNGNIIGKVENTINVLHRKSEEITSKNLSMRVEIDKIKSCMNSYESERVLCKKKLVDLKDNAKSMKDEFEKKEEIRNQLKNTYEKLKRGNKRSTYTKRIMEIISNVDKQNLEIQKILEDTRQLQKEINTLEGQLDRCFTMADETFFRDAKKDDQAKKAYKLLALLHSECNTIVSLVNDTGTLSRDIVDLEDNIKAEKLKRTEDTLQKIQLDLVKIQEECVEK